jgi:hypothetical protein
MDAARQSAIAAVVVGGLTAALGLAIVALATGALPSPDGAIHVPRLLLALVGCGVVACGASFGLCALGLRVALGLALPGVALTFVLPLAWFAWGPGEARCTVSLGTAATNFSAAAPLPEGECHALVAAAAALSLGAVLALAWALMLLRRRGG